MSTTRIGISEQENGPTALQRLGPGQRRMRVPPTRRRIRPRLDFINAIRND